VSWRCRTWGRRYNDRWHDQVLCRPRCKSRRCRASGRCVRAEVTWNRTMDKARLDGGLEKYWVRFDLYLALSTNVSFIQSCLIKRADSISEMTNSLVRLRQRLGSDSIYFEKVYKHTFDFARNEGQRSIGETQISCIIL